MIALPFLDFKKFISIFLKVETNPKFRLKFSKRIKLERVRKIRKFQPLYKFYMERQPQKEKLETETVGS